MIICGSQTRFTGIVAIPHVEISSAAIALKVFEKDLQLGYAVRH